MPGALQFDNSFGRVFSDRICFNLRKGWFGGQIQVDFAARHVTSIRDEVSRNVGAGIVLALIGLLCISVGGGVMIVGLIFIGLAVVALIGSPSVTIVTAGGESHTSMGSFSQKVEAAEFAGAVKQVLFAEQQHPPASIPVRDEVPVARADTRPCPICAEDVKAAAVKCRFCGTDLQAA